MKGKICSLSVASFLLLAAVGSVHAQTTEPVSCDPMPVDKKGAPKYLKYTVNYAASNSTSTPVTETVVVVSNVGKAKKKQVDECVYVLFKDKAGAQVGVAAGHVPANATKVFATATAVGAVTPPPPFMVDYPKDAVDSSGTPVPAAGFPLEPFEGKAEVYSKNPSLQLANFLVTGGVLTPLPVQKMKQATKGGH